MPYLYRDNGARRAAETRKRILDAALHCFAARGYEGTSMRQLAECCDLTDAALYYHFESKQALMEAVLRERWGCLAAPAVGTHASRGAAGALAHLIDLILDRWADHADYLRVLAREAHTSALARELYARIADEWADSMTALLAERLRADDAARIARSVRYTVVGVLFTGLQEHGAGFADLALQPGFRTHVHSLVRAVAPVERFEALPAAQ